MFGLIIAGILLTGFAAFYEVSRIDAFKLYIKGQIHKQNGKWLDYDASLQNFNDSWPWDWNFEKMKVERN